MVGGDLDESMRQYLGDVYSIASIEDVPEQMDGEDISDIWFGESRPRTRPLFWKVSAVAAYPTAQKRCNQVHDN